MRQAHKAGIKTQRLLTSSNLEVIAELTASGCGIGILPSKVATRALSPLKKTPKAPAVTDTHCLIYRVESKNIRALQEITGGIRGCFK